MPRSKRKQKERGERERKREKEIDRKKDRVRGKHFVNTPKFDHFSLNDSIDSASDPDQEYTYIIC